MKNKETEFQGIPILSSGFHVCISTSDFERSINFYQALGFSSEGQIGVEREKFRMQYLIHSENKALIEIICHFDRKDIPQTSFERKDIVGVNHFGFHVSDLKKTRMQLKKLGAEIVEDDSRGAYDFIFVKGPDGELIGFAEFKESFGESE